MVTLVQRISGLVRPTGLVSRIRHTPLGNQKFQQLPAPTGPPPYRLSLDSVLDKTQISKIDSSKRIIFHTVGDTGNLQGPTPQQQGVIDAMEADFKPTGSPAFFYHLGDIIYFSGQPEGYYPQFFEPYLHYPAPIFAIAGNHDGDPRPGDPPSLTAFKRNFCAKAPTISQDGQDAPRLTMTQPNVYWTLLAPWVTIIGLYSNVPAGGVVAPDQLTWLTKELSSAPKEKALILAVHHPIYSLDTFHGGSTTLEETLDGAYAKSGRRPDLVLTGHVHDFQRYTEVIDGQHFPHIVAGAGGYVHLHPMQRRPDGSPLEVPFKLQDADDVTLENYCDNRHGFMRLEVTDSLITGEYLAVEPSSAQSGGQAQRIDSFELDYKSHTLNKSTRLP